MLFVNENIRYPKTRCIIGNHPGKTDLILSFVYSEAYRICLRIDLPMRF